MHLCSLVSEEQPLASPGGAGGVKVHLPALISGGAAAGLSGLSSQPKVDDAGLDDIAE